MNPLFIQALIEHGILQVVERHPTDPRKDKFVATKKTDAFIEFMEAYKDNKEFRQWANDVVKVIELQKEIDEMKGERSMLERKKAEMESQIKFYKELLKRLDEMRKKRNAQVR